MCVVTVSKLGKFVESVSGRNAVDVSVRNCQSRVKWTWIGLYTSDKQQLVMVVQKCQESVMCMCKVYVLRDVVSVM